jgi:hypothetical protein
VMVGLLEQGTNGAPDRRAWQHRVAAGSRAYASPVRPATPRKSAGSRSPLATAIVAGGRAGATGWRRRGSARECGLKSPGHPLDRGGAPLWQHDRALWGGGLLAPRRGVKSLASMRVAEEVGRVSANPSARSVVAAPPTLCRSRPEGRTRPRSGQVTPAKQGVLPSRHLCPALASKRHSRGAPAIAA